MSRSARQEDGGRGWGGVGEYMLRSGTKRVPTFNNIKYNSHLTDKTAIKIKKPHPTDRVSGISVRLTRIASDIRIKEVKNWSFSSEMSPRTFINKDAFLGTKNDQLRLSERQ